MKYDETELSQSEINRIRRHKRKVRNRAIAITFFLLFLALVAVGVWFVTIKIVSDMNTKASISAAQEAEAASASAASASEQEDINEIIDSLLSEEDEVVDPEDGEKELTPEELLDLEVTNLISSMTIGEKVSGLFLITPEELSSVDLAVMAGESTKNSLTDYNVGGLVYSDGNILSTEQFTEMMTNTQSYAKFKLFTCLDEGFGKEGILATKLGLDASKAASEIIETMDPYNAFVESTTISKNLNSVGVNTSFGLHNLTIDPELNEDGSVASTNGTALFGNDWVVAGQMAAQAVTALNENNTFSFVSTFPNTGSGEEESDKKTTKLSKEEFADNGLNVFKTSIEAGAKGLVIGNVYVPNMTKDELPASLSKEFITDYVRLELGFTDVVVITDRLDGSEITEYYSAGEASVMAIKAGADMVQCPESFKEAYIAVLEAISRGEISEDRIDQSLKRIFKVKYAPKNEAATEEGRQDGENEAPEEGGTDNQ